MRIAAVWVLVGATACGGAAAEPVPQQVVVKESRVAQAPTADASPEPDRDAPGAGQVGQVEAAERIEVAGFVRFVALEHGATKADLEALLPEQAPGLGPRSPADMAGSSGVRYPGHLEVAWDPTTRRLQYIGIKSPAAVDYLEQRGHGDPRVRILWGKSPAALEAMLGAPTETYDRPHALTWRYEFTAPGGREGALALELSKLGDHPAVSAVSVHWK
jgi:hypothetical protein